MSPIEFVSLLEASKQSRQMQSEMSLKGEQIPEPKYHSKKKTGIKFFRWLNSQRVALGKKVLSHSH